MKKMKSEARATTTIARAKAGQGVGPVADDGSEATDCDEVLVRRFGAQENKNKPRAEQKKKAAKPRKPKLADFISR